jgi:hypothetical protein
VIDPLSRTPIPAPACIDQHSKPLNAFFMKETQ